MDNETLAVLSADIKGQTQLIDDIYAKLAARTAHLDPNDGMQLESAAYQLHNLYTAIEDLFKVVAGHFENRITDTSHWHIELLGRMKQEIAGVRPALLSQESYALLNSLRSFRHFFRHSYGAHIEYHQLLINLDKARGLRSHIKQDISRFMQRLHATTPK